MKFAFPYRVLPPGDIGIEVMSVKADDLELPYARISKVERTVALHGNGRDEWDTAFIRVRADVPEQEISQGPWSDIACLAVISERATNARSTVRLTHTRGNEWEGNIEFVRSRHARRASLALAVVGTVDGVAGRVIGTAADEWYLDLRSRTPKRQREIRIVQTDFREGPYEWLRAFKDSPWIVETTDEIPAVYLNTAGVEGFVDALDSRSGEPLEKNLRELAASQIAQDAWTAMFHTAIGNLELDEGGTPVLPNGWRGSVLRAMLPDVIPGLQLADALYEINERRQKGFGWSQVQTGIHFAAGKRSQVARKLTNAVRTVHSAERTVDR